MLNDLACLNCISCEAVLEEVLENPAIAVHPRRSRWRWYLAAAWLVAAIALVVTIKDYRAREGGLMALTQITAMDQEPPPQFFEEGQLSEDLSHLIGMGEGPRYQQAKWLHDKYPEMHHELIVRWICGAVVSVAVTSLYNSLRRPAPVGRRYN